MQLNGMKDLGLSEGQISVYTAVLELGSSSLNKIQKKTGIERRNIYDILNKLIEKGLISYITEKRIKVFQCTHPNKLMEEINKKENSLDKLKGQIPQMISLFNEVKQNIRADVYRGNESIKALLNEALEFEATYWIGGNSGVEGTNLKIWFKHWMNQRVKKKRIMYDLADYGFYLEGLKPLDIKKHKKEYYEYCMLPKDLSSPMVVLIFGNKVAQILWSSQSFAFVLESEEIKDSFMKYFNYFWKNPW